MFVLLDKKTGGVYAINDDETNDKVVQIFVDIDDASRYHMMLEEAEYKRKLEVTEVERDVVVANCLAHGYSYAIITPDDFVIPPL